MTTGARDAAGNPLPAAKTWRFTTTSRPFVQSVSPAAGASGVARTTKVTAAFDRAMNKSSVEAAFSLKRTSNGATVSGSFSWNGNEMTFTPNAALNGTTSYTAAVGTGARDTAGTNLAAAKSWQFTTASQPVISTVMPSDGAAEVLPDALAFAVFDTAMDKPSAEAAFSLKRTSNGASVAGSFIWFGNALIFKPGSILESGTQYTATVTTGARDAAGNPLPAAKTWSFTTTSRPFVQSVSPAAGASGVARTTKVTAAFDRAMNKSSVEAAFSLKRTSNGATVSGSFSWNGNEMTFTPNAALNGTTSYTAAVGTGARDTAGTNLAAAKSWQFTTASQPVISTVMPSDGAAEVLPDALAFAVFDTAMDKPSAEAAFSLKRTSNGASVAGSFIWFGNALIFKPGSILEAARNTRQRSTTGARDAAGNPLPAAKTWQFTTTSRPFVQSVSPAAGASGVARDSLTIVLFNKQMDKPQRESCLLAEADQRRRSSVAGTFVLVRKRTDLQARPPRSRRNAVHGSDRRDRQGPRRKHRRQPDDLEVHDRQLTRGRPALRRRGRGGPRRRR